MFPSPSKSNRTGAEALPETNTPDTRLLLETLHDPVAIVWDGAILWVNQAHADLFGYASPSEMIGMPLSSLVVAPDHEQAMKRGSLRRKGVELPEVYEVRVRRRDGLVRTVMTRTTRVLYDGSLASMVVLRDVTERQLVQERLRQALSQQRGLMESAAEAVLLLSMAGEVVDFNQRFVDLWGLPRDFVRMREQDWSQYIGFNMRQLRNPEILKVSVTDVISQPDQSYRDTLLFRDGRVVERYGYPQMIDGEVVGVVWNHRDVTEQRRMEELLSHQANHDSLTDLLNRRGFRQTLTASLEDASRSGKRGALLLLDLDEFKDVNDTLGHPAGDVVLTQTAALLRRELGEEAAIARFGGDEFAILLPAAGLQRARRAGRRLLDAIVHHAFEAEEGQKVALTASIGIVLFPGHGANVEDLMSRADIALYGAKNRGRNRMEVYAARDLTQSSARDRLHVRHLLNEALQNDALHLMAQPILNLSEDFVAGHELLLRLKAPDGTTIGAQRLIEVAERSGMILAVDRWVTRQAVHILAGLAWDGSDVSIEVNLSGRSLNDPDLLAFLSNEVATHAIDPRNLIFEVTETAAISNLATARRFIRSLKDLGCRFALDDFGVGYSSLNHLQNLPVDFLKIDGSFVRGITANPQAQELVRGMITIARALGMQTIAESVGSKAEAELLRELGCDFAQGYWVGRPKDASRVFGASAARRAA